MIQLHFSFLPLAQWQEANKQNMALGFDERERHMATSEFLGQSLYQLTEGK